jgi:FkbM family methyltransferase
MTTEPMIVDTTRVVVPAKVLPQKTILIAVPTNKYIEPETMKSIYDQEIPPGYKTTFQFFYGYQIDQIRNLIADWAVKYDYLWAIDSDMSFPPDTLKRLLAHDKDVVSGLYIQRKPGQHILELYRNGRNIPYNDIKGLGLIEVDGCGFGCVLIKSEVLRAVGYPQFVYKSAINHANTVSEDTYFCLKAKERGYKVWADTSILCNHHGSTVFVVDPTPVKSTFDRLLELSNTRLLPKAHVDYLHQLGQQGIQPKVIYDIGACVLHWTREAVGVWPQARYIAFDAMEESAEIFKHFNVPHHIGVLSDVDGKKVSFHKNVQHPGGNTYYKENEEINPNTRNYFTEDNVFERETITLDTLVKTHDLPLPDMIKMDVQGAEMDVLKGAESTLQQCKYLILELQKVEYNKGAPLREEVFEYLKSIGFTGTFIPFSDNGPDGDFFFTRQ